MHANPYKHEMVMYFLEGAVEVFKATHPDMPYEQNIGEVRDKIKQLVSHMVYSYEKVVGNDYFNDGDFRLNHEQAVAIMNQAIEILKAVRPASGSAPTKQEIMDRFNNVYDELLWLYHWFIAHDCKRKE